MSVAALSRLLEAVAKSIKHATAMSTLLTTELFQARRDAALASSKLQLDNSTYELRNAPINSKSLFDGRIKEIAKSNFEAQQQRFLASTSIQSQSHSYKPPSQSRAFKIPKYPAKQTTLAHFAEKWEEITDNKWVLSIVRNGFRIPFIKIPPLSSVPIRMSQSSSPFLREEIENLLNKRAVERVQNPETLGFYSRIFLVPKKNGKFRLILDLSLLNRT